MRCFDLTTLEIALKKAAEAHHSYEEKLGHPDKDWPLWYAQHIMDGKAHFQNVLVLDNTPTKKCF